MINFDNLSTLPSQINLEIIAFYVNSEQLKFHVFSFEGKKN